MISYGYFRLCRSTEVRSLKLMGNRSLEESSCLNALAGSIKAEKPDGARYEDTFDLDNVLALLGEEFETRPLSKLRGSEKADRDRLRKTVVITLKLDGLYRSSDILQMQRGSLFDRQAAEGSRWGPSEQADMVLDHVILHAANSKTSTFEDKIMKCTEHPLLCPVTALFHYVRCIRQFGEQKLDWFVEPENHRCRLLSSNRQAAKIRQITSADPITKDTNTFLEAAGVPKHFTSHALRSAVGSSMKERGATDSEIMNRGRWKSVSVFRKFYDRSRLKQLSVRDLRQSPEGSDNE